VFLQPGCRLSIAGYEELLMSRMPIANFSQSNTTPVGRFRLMPTGWQGNLIVS
jgi:hypothetical protein